MANATHSDWIVRLLRDAYQARSGHKGLRMKEFRELFPLAFSETNEVELIEAMNQLIADQTLIAFDVERKTVCNGWRSRSCVIRADVVTNVGAVSNAMVYFANRDDLPREIRKHAERAQKCLHRALKARDG